MVYDTTVTLGEFLDAAAAKQSVPGGGATAALTGALAASMAEMVLNYSVNKKGLEHFQSELKPALELAHQARRNLEGLIAADQEAYQRMTSVRKLPPDSPERLAQWPAVVAAAIEVPKSITSNCVDLLELCDNVVNFVNPMLLSDLAVAADLAMAAARCGVYNVRINLPEVPDEAARTQIEGSIAELMMRCSKVIQRVSPRIWDRVELETA
jgi:methenyltetrahydrofolate cyclohydrolase